MEKQRKTKILAVGDIHANSTSIKRLVETAKKENVDIVILAGDLTIAERDLKNIVGPFAKYHQVLLIPGNHESVATIDFLAELYKAKNIHGSYFIKYNLGIFGAGGADIGIHQVEESEISALLKKGHEKIKNLEKKIMVTHIHPLGTK
ncbi:MAG: metallophosphoesterase, partial [Nanoarchaeota archaeon]